MKKSLRILSLVLAVVMVMGSMSVLASAYAPYRGSGVTLSYDDVDIPTFSTDQYASMALDALDKLLAEKHLVVDIYIGTLDLSSIDGTVTSVKQLIASVESILNLLGDGSKLKTILNSTILKTNNETSRAKGDVQVLWDLLDLIGALKGLLQKYVQEGLDLGIVNGFVGNYMFNVRELVLGLVYGLTGLGDKTDEDGNVIEEYDYMESRTLPDAIKNAANPPLTLVQLLLNKYVLGEWKKLDDLFYSETNKGSNVVYSEYEFHVGSASGALVTDAAPNTTAYDYYGFVHPDRWVTQTLGDAIRVANGAEAPTASYSKVNILNMSNTYDFVEPLLLYAYNNVAVPVLNRIVKRWLNEKVGYYFDPAKMEEWVYDDTGAQVFDETGKPVRNPSFDYMYMGEKVEGAETSDRIFEIFDMDNFKIPKAGITNNGKTFIQNLNRNATLILPYVFKGNYTVNGATQPKTYIPTQDGTVYRFTWSGTTKDGAPASYSMNWTFGGNEYLGANACNLVRFVLQVTEDEFFSDVLINKEQLKTPAEVNGMTNDQLLAYILRSVINANVEGMWIPETTETQSLLGVGFEAVVQLAYQDIPQFTYTKPTGGNQAVVEKALAILMDVAAYKLNAELDTDIDTNIGPNTAIGTTNNGNTNNTGLLGYLGNGGSYGSTIVKIAKWAVKTYTDTSYGNILYGISPELLGSNPSVDSFWNDLDTVLNAIIPIKASNSGTQYPDNRPWISSQLASQTPVIKSFIFDSVINSILDTTDPNFPNLSNTLELLNKNNQGALAADSFEVAIVDTLHRIFDLLFPNVFSNSVNTLNGVLNNQLLGNMIYDLAVTLSATGSDAGQTNPGTITGRGKAIVEFALPIVCMILGLTDKQEFKELENYAPELIDTGKNTFLIYNGSEGINTSYRSPEDGLRKYDDLFTYKINSVVINVIGTNQTVTLNGLVPGDEIEAGESKEVYIEGAPNDKMLKIEITYRVKDESGSYLQSNGQDVILTSRKYIYCGPKGNDEIPDKEDPGVPSVNGYKLLYPTDVYITGGLSSLEGYTIRVVDKKGSTGNVKVTGVSGGTLSGKTWVSANSEVDKNNRSINDQDLAGQGATYIFSPFEVAEEAYRQSYEYAKDEEGKVIYNETTGLPTVTGDAPLEDASAYYVPYDTYALTTSLNVAGTPTTVTTYVHIYNDWGLPSLVNNAIAANRSVDTLTQVGQGMYQAYENALLNAAQFVLEPRKYSGTAFDTHIAKQGNGYNQYSTLYGALYQQIENIKHEDSGSNPDTLRSLVDAKFPYNYTRAQATFDGTSAYYRDYIEYYESGYRFLGQRNYVGHTYKQFKNAVSYANGLIEREHKYIDGDPETWESLSADDRANRVQNYLDAVENASAINSVSAAYAVHRLDLTYSRLIELTGASKDKLNKAVLAYANETNTGYSVSSWKDYTNAKTFAVNTNNENNPNAEKINTAMNKLIEAWKHLEKGAVYTALEQAIASAKTFLVNDVDGWGLTGGRVTDPIIAESDFATVAADQEFYSDSTFIALLTAIKNADKLIADRDAGNDLGASDQGIVDAAKKAIEDARAGLLPKGSDPGPGPGGDEEEPVFSVKTEDEFDAPFTNFYYVYEFYPQDILVDDSFFGQFGYTEVRDGEYEGTAIDGIIIGVPEGFASTDIESIFNTEYCTVEVTDSSFGGPGTGSFAIIKDNDDNVIGCYLISLRGDVDGSGMIDIDDAAVIDHFSNYEEGYNWWDEYDNPGVLGADAADTSTDGWVDIFDYQIIDNYANAYLDFNPLTGEQQEE